MSFINQNELISIIVPVYNVEKYLGRCVDSLINQTYTNIEIILVDDGSPDNCPQICDAYARKDARIKVVHQKNRGLSGARNTGIKSATGEYIGFLDSDDCIDPRMYEILINTCIKNDCDISFCAYEKFSEQVPEEKICNSECEVLLDDEIFTNYFNYNHDIMTVVWNKIYKKELFNDIIFPEGKIHEDEAVSYKLLYKAHKVVYVKDLLYFYFQRNESIIGVGFNEKSLDRLDAFKDRQDFFYEKSDEIYKLCSYNMQYWIVLYLINGIFEHKFWTEILEYEKWCWNSQNKIMVKEYLWKAIYSCIKQKKMDRKTLKEILDEEVIREIVSRDFSKEFSFFDKKYLFVSGKKMKTLMMLYSLLV